jgi:hypothetical protein
MTGLFRFSCPLGFCFVLVADVVQYPAGSSTAPNLIYGQTGVASTTQSTLDFPDGVSVDIAGDHFSVVIVVSISLLHVGNVYVADSFNNRVMQWYNVPITLLPASGVPTSITGAATVAAGTTTTIGPGNVTVSKTLAVAANGTLVLGPGAVVNASYVLLIGALNVSSCNSSGLQSNGTVSLQATATLTVTVDCVPASGASITVVVAQYASFGGGAFASTSTVATFARTQDFVFGAPVITTTATELTARIAVTRIVSSVTGGECFSV